MAFCSYLCYLFNPPVFFLLILILVLPVVCVCLVYRVHPMCVCINRIMLRWLMHTQALST